MMRVMVVVFALGCGSKTAPPPPRSPDYGQQVVMDMKAYADRECQCAERVDPACSKQNVSERETYQARIDRASPFSAEENAALDAEEKRFQECTKRFQPVILE